ncbi:MAG: aldehyde ferredoxin oxidoreductase C-terminal domain-containing protein [Chloroflexota bacterium]
MCLGVEAFGDSTTNPRGGQSQALVRSPSTAVPGLPLSAVQAIAAAYQIPQAAQQRIFQDKKWHVARLTPYVQNINTGYNSLGVCYRFFIGRLWNPVIASAIYEAATGIPLTPEEFMLAGERVWNLQKVLNLREGFGREHDHLPARWMNEPVQFGDSEVYLQDYDRTHRLTATDIEKMLDAYYDERGWSLENGSPTREKLISLELDSIAGDLKNAGKI